MSTDGQKCNTLNSDLDNSGRNDSICVPSHILLYWSFKILSTKPSSHWEVHQNAAYYSRAHKGPKTVWTLGTLNVILVTQWNLWYKSGGTTLFCFWLMRHKISVSCWSLRTQVDDLELTLNVHCTQHLYNYSLCIKRICLPNFKLGFNQIFVWNQ